jgi:hypothetical protein
MAVVLGPNEALPYHIHTYNGNNNTNWLKPVYAQEKKINIHKI